MAAGERRIIIKIDGDAKGLVVAGQVGERSVSRLKNEVDRTDGGFRRSLASVTKFALAISALSSGIGVLHGLGAGIASASGSLIALPALAGAAAAVIATMKLGADGASDAFSRMSVSLDPLKARISAVFERGLRPGVDSLNRTIPKLSGGFEDVAYELAAIGKNAARTLELPKNTETLNGLLGQTSGLMDGVRRAVRPLITAFLDVVAVGSSGFTSMGDRIADAAQRFADFIARARESGELRRILDSGIASLKSLWQTLKDIGAITAAVFRGLSEGAGGIAGSFQPAIRALRDFVESAPGQQMLRQIGAAMAEIGDAVGRILRPALAAIGPLIGPIATAFAALVTTLANIATPIVAVVGPALEAFGNFLSDNEGLVRGLAAAVGALVVPIVAVAVPLRLASGALNLFHGAMSRLSALSVIIPSRLQGMAAGFQRMSTAGKIATVGMGVVGLALTGVTFALSAFSGLSASAAARQQQLGDFAKNVADEIGRQNGVINENVRSVAAAEAANNGWAKTAQKVGISSKDLINALLGEGDARERVLGQLDDYILGIQKQGIAGQAQLPALRALRDAIDGGNGAIDDRVGLNKYLAEGTKDAAKFTGFAARADEDYRNKIAELSGAFQRQIDLATELEQKRRKLAGIALDAREAERNFQDAIDRASEALKRNGRSIDNNTEAGRDNNAALDNIVTTTLDDVIPAMQAQGATTDQIRSKVQTARDRFISLATQMGYTAPQARRLADNLGLIPGNYNAKVNANTSPAALKIRELERRLKDLTRARTIPISAQGAIGSGLFRAAGGPVLPGRSYVVGERGPEIFRAPNTGGTIVPNHDIGGGDVKVYVSIDGQQLQGRIDRTVRENNRSIRRGATAGTGGAR